MPSLSSIAVTFVMLRLVERRRIVGDCACDVPREPLSRGGWTALAGIVATAMLLLAISALDAPLGLATCLAGLATAGGVCLLSRRSPKELASAISWGVLPLVAGLFVLV